MGRAHAQAGIHNSQLCLHVQDEGCWEVEAVDDFDELGLESEVQVHMHRIRLKA